MNPNDLRQEIFIALPRGRAIKHKILYSPYSLSKLYLLLLNKKIVLRKSTNRNITSSPILYLKNHEIQRMILFSTNSRNQCIIGLLYSAGLRVIELTTIKNSFIDFTNYQIHIINPLTKKLRSLPLSPSLIPYLKNYRKCYSNGHLVFKGYKNSSLCPRTVQKIVEKSAIMTGIKGRVTPTMLRSSFAIHLLQAGTRPEIVQQLLGLVSEQSIQKYIFATNGDGFKLKSPLD